MKVSSKKACFYFVLITLVCISWALLVCEGESDGLKKAVNKFLGKPKPAVPIVEWEFVVGRKVPQKMILRGDGVYLADSVGNILALSVTEGSQRKVVHTPAPIMSWGMQGWHIASSSIDKQVRLNDITTGEELWSVPCETTPSEPTVTPSGVIVSEGLGPYIVKHLHLGNGSLLWRREFQAKPSGYEPVITDGRVIIAFEDRYIRALHLADGSTGWEYQVGEPLEINPDGRWKGRWDFLGAEGEMAMRLKAMQAGGIGRMVNVDTRNVIIPSEDGFVRSLDPRTGELNWEQKFSDRVWHAWYNKFYSSFPWVYCDTIEGRLSRLEPSTGEVRDTVDLVEPTQSLVTFGLWIIVDRMGDNGELIFRTANHLENVRTLNLDITLVNGIATHERLIARTDDGRIVSILMLGF